MPQTSAGNPVLAAVTRGGVIESAHRGSVAVCDAQGKIVFALGDIETPVFPRSAVKALQALPLVETGAAARFGLSGAEIALACASHSGEPEHAATAASALAKAGVALTCLECGAHWPMGEKYARALAQAGSVPNALHNNCSGKHAGFVCTALDQNIDPKGYIGPDHPVMRQVTRALAQTTGADLARLPVGVDGCSIPTYAIPLVNIATAFARFGTGEGWDSTRAQAAGVIRKAVAENPFMIAGTGRFDTLVTAHFGSRVFLKMGAEGVYCAAFPELGLGLAAKMEDGATRASEVAMAALIAKFLPLKGEDQAFLAEKLDQPMHNWNGIEVGRIIAAGAFATQQQG